MPHEKLLLDFLTSDLPLTELAHKHSLSLEQLFAWADSPETTRLFDDLQRIAARRSALIAAESSAKALGNLADLSFALARRSELANAAATTAAAPKPPSITALETSRKACSALLRLFPAKSHLSPLLKPSQHSTRPAPDTSPVPPSPPAAPNFPSPVHLPTCSPLHPSTPSPLHPLTPSPIPAASRLASLAGTIPSRNSGLISPPDPSFQSLSFAGISTG